MKKDKLKCIEEQGFKFQPQQFCWYCGWWKTTLEHSHHKCGFWL